mmetsp:Transcript_3275/g.6683  ORF Transcript_3275/g.6683 Transcript_3275/m.6683 type:complete len:180 (+) Transcript_3275:168-707(+)
MIFFPLKPPFFYWSNSIQKFKSQKVLLKRKEILFCLYKKKDLPNIEGHCCRVAIGQFKKKNNIYCIGEIVKLFFPQKKKVVSENFSLGKIIIKFGKILRIFNLAFISDSFPNRNEILDFSHKNLKFFSESLSCVSFPREIKNFKPFETVNSNGKKQKKSFDLFRIEKFFFFGTKWNFLL